MVHELVDAGEQVVVLDNLTTGFDLAVPPSAKLAIGDVGDQSCVAALSIGSTPSAISPPRSSCLIPFATQFWQNEAKIINLFNGRPFISFCACRRTK
jgi:nucleoside-diphosphate-sugar epimerase